ncbi:MAG TPA: ABC transporter permease [Nocardioidaceae bacterium]|nr:ABC transporter permease [Nocardioidaceae bacterium]
MTGLVRAELRKISSTRLWWGLLLAAVVYTAVSAGATAGFAGVEPGGGQPASPGLDTASAIRGVYAGAAFSGAYILAMILGITGMTGEYRYQTITATFLSCPRRGRVVAAKMAAHLGYGLGYGVVALVTAVVVGAIVIAARGYALGFSTDGLGRAMALAVVAVALWTLVGIGIGTLIRNQIVAILVGVFLTFLLEPLVSLALHALDWDAVSKYLPSNASTALTSASNPYVDFLSWWAGGLVLLGYAVVFAAIGVLLSRRRDIT